MGVRCPVRGAGRDPNLRHTRCNVGRGCGVARRGAASARGARGLGSGIGPLARRPANCILSAVFPARDNARSSPRIRSLSGLSVRVGRSFVLNLRKCRIGVVGLGYVGLPLAVEFGKHFDTVGFDVKERRIAELKARRDSTLEVTSKELASAARLTFTTSLADLKRCRVFIVTVTTPIDEYKRPDLSPLVGASTSVGKILKKGDVVVYESTVYPGCTEEVCV